MRLVRYECGGRIAVGALRGGAVIELASPLGHKDIDLEHVIVRWADVRREIERHVERASPAAWLDEVRLLAPLYRPQKIVAIGSNYPRPGAAAAPGSKPVLFFKPPSALTGPYDPIRLPPEALTVVGEVELAVVIGLAGDRISPNEASRHVFGYMVANDVTAPEILLGEAALNPLFLQQSRGKGFRTFCPIGPWIETAHDRPFPPVWTLEQKVDGHCEMCGSSDQMITGLGELIADASRAFGLEPGDIVLTGSPAPLDGRRVPLVAGSVLHSRIAEIGEMANPVVSEGAAQRSGA